MAPRRARVAELADAPALGAGRETCGGSNPPSRTTSDGLQLPVGYAGYVSPLGTRRLQVHRYSMILVYSEARAGSFRDI